MHQDKKQPKPNLEQTKPDIIKPELNQLCKPKPNLEKAKPS